MKKGKHLRKAHGIFLCLAYLAVLYYLLPFKPLALYHTTQYKKTEQRLLDHSVKQLQYGYRIFAKKERTRFFLSSDIVATFKQPKVILPEAEVRLLYLFVEHYVPSLSYIPERSPPFA